MFELEMFHATRTSLELDRIERKKFCSAPQSIHKSTTEALGPSQTKSERTIDQKKQQRNT